jgi:hypothetical protein
VAVAVHPVDGDSAAERRRAVFPRIPHAVQRRAHRGCAYRALRSHTFQL